MPTSANLATNDGERCSSRSKRMTTRPHASSEWPVAFSGVRAFHQGERIGEHTPGPAHRGWENPRQSLAREHSFERATLHAVLECEFHGKRVLLLKPQVKRRHAAFPSGKLLDSWQLSAGMTCTQPTIAFSLSGTQDRPLPSTSVMLSCLRAPGFVLKTLCPACSRGKGIQPVASRKAHRQWRTDDVPPCRFSFCAMASPTSFPVPSESFRVTLPQSPRPRLQKKVEA